MDKNNDKLFDDFFSKGFVNENNQIKPDKTEWEALANRLDRHQGIQNSSSWSWLWLLIPFFILFQTWTAYQWFQTRQKLDSFVKSTYQKHSRSFTDTISNVVSTTYYDTIYKTVIIEQKIYRTTTNGTIPEHQVQEVDSQIPDNQRFNHVNTSGSLSKDFNAIQQKEKTGQGDNASGINEEENSINVVPHLSPFGQKTPIKNRDTTENKEKINQQNVSGGNPSVFTEVPVTPSEKDISTAIEDESINSQNITTPDIQTKPDKTLADFMANQKPRSAGNTFLDDIIPGEGEHAWRFGISAGSILPMTRGEIDIVNPFSFQTNLEWIVGKHISILPTLSYAQYEFETEQPFLMRLGIPQPEKLADNVSFSEAEGIQRYIIPSLQIRYRIRPDKALTWFIGTGITAFIPQRLDIEYDYLDEDLIEITTILNGYKPKAKFACLNLHGGIQYNINQSASIFSDIHTTWDLRRSNPGFHYINPQLGVKFFIK